MNILFTNPHLSERAIAERDLELAQHHREFAELQAALAAQQRVTAEREFELGQLRQTLAALKAALAQRSAELGAARSALATLQESAGVRLLEATRRLPVVYSTYLFLKQRARWPMLRTGAAVPTR